MTSLVFRLAPVVLAVVMQTPAVEPGFTPLFNGKDFTGWKLSNAPSFTIENGAIVAKAVGMQGHAFYDGPFMDHSFRNFELKVDVMTRQNSNGGIFILTEFVEKGWPSKGFEIQVNNSYMKDPRKTGSLYNISDVMDSAGQRRRVVHRAHHRAGRHRHDQSERQAGRAVDAAEGRQPRLWQADDHAGHGRASGARSEQHRLLQEHPHQAAEVDRALT